jgi:hypothetical protein
MEVDPMKKVLSIFIAAAMFFSLAQFAMATAPYAPQYEREAQVLYDYGMLAGTDKGLELDKPLTRLEGAVMIARLLGKEQEIKDGKYSQMEHPFKDVPTWGNEYVKFMYGNKITAGTGKTTFGSSDKMTAAQYTTFLLRVLGYDDSKGDFKWDKSLEKAWKVNLITYKDALAIDESEDFLRDHMAYLTLHALNLKPKDGGDTLLFQLAEKGVIKVSEEEDTSPIKDRIITSGISVYRPSADSNSVITVIDRDELPESMQDYVYLHTSSTKGVTNIDGFFNEWWTNFFKEATLNQGTSMQSSSPPEQTFFVFLFNSKREIIGHRTVQPSEIIIGEPPTEK